ncbi:MAG: hypothetical protein WD960_11650 [Gemmatimonadota bacterium]
MREGKVLAEHFRVDYNLERPDLWPGYLTPAERGVGARSVALDPLLRVAGEASEGRLYSHSHNT